MCGIAGFLPRSSDAAADAPEIVARMCTRLRTRGPDAEGFWRDEAVVLGHRRLSILDLDERANQPMLSHDSRYVIVFNGEIYNYRDLKRDLEAEGIAFRTSSDTEVLLALFEREGTAMLPRLRGMFAFAIWDTQTRQLFLARDPYGIKPLYYAQTPNGFLFSSQVKALQASGIASRERESAGLAGFYLWGSVPEPWTMFRDIFALPAGHWVRVTPEAVAAPVCWYDIREHWSQGTEDGSISDLQERVRDAVSRSVAAHLVADVPVSVFLSGGIDSGAVAGLVAEAGEKVEGVTIGFEEFSGQHQDETPVAAAIAARYGLPHRIRWVTRAEFETDLPLILDAMDQPSVDGVNTWFASKATAELGYKVVLSGVGGDELFGGYSSFKRIPQAAAFARLVGAVPGARAALRWPCALLAARLNQPKLAAVPNFMHSAQGLYFLTRGLFLPDELPHIMGREISEEGLARLDMGRSGGVTSESRNGSAAVGLFESTRYLRNQLLRDSDWASMAHSLELRTPLVDAALLRDLAPFLSSFPQRGGKMMLAKAPRRPLPDEVINRAKTGFGVPMANWLMTERQSPKPETAQLGNWSRRWAIAVAAHSAS